MPEIDQRDKLEEEPFRFQITKSKKVFLFWQGKQIKALKGKEAQQFIEKITALDSQGAQLLMAKLTGNFKHGNER